MLENVIIKAKESTRSKTSHRLIHLTCRSEMFERRRKALQHEMEMHGREKCVAGKPISWPNDVLCV